MKVYFENSLKQMREIADITNGTSEDASKVIQDFLAEHNFKSYYQRRYNIPKNGTRMTCIDVGSWSEFFYVDPPIM